jgi:hypothetical protein
VKWKVWGFVLVMVGVVVALALLIRGAPQFPVARLRVVDGAGKPVAGAVIQPEGVRTKPGPYNSGWYSWRKDKDSPTNAPVTTDQDGYASVPYPKYVFERIETGTLCLAVNHPNFVPDRPERVVTTALPAGAPWRARVDDLWNRIQHNTIMAHADPIVLKTGATLILSVRPGSGPQDNTPLFAQVPMDVSPTDTNFWTHPEPGKLETRRLAAGSAMVRAIRFDAQGRAWFSDVLTVAAVAGQTNELTVDLKPGVTVHGQLDASAVRPISHGRVIAHVWPQGQSGQGSAPQWHAWTTIREDGSFEIDSLPAGDLEILALCDGYVSTNGPGKFKFRYPQKHVLGTNDISITIGMEPTARLEVFVTDDQGKPLQGATVSFWPNARYGEWSAVILAGDCYNTADLLLATADKPFSGWHHPVPDFEGVSDSNGLAVVPNLPADVTQYSVEHDRFVLPAMGGFGGQKNRQATVPLQAGMTNHASVQLEPKDKSPIAHY